MAAGTVINDFYIPDDSKIKNVDANTDLSVYTSTETKTLQVLHKLQKYFQDKVRTSQKKVKEQSKIEQESSQQLAQAKRNIGHMSLAAGGAEISKLFEDKGGVHFLRGRIWPGSDSMRSRQSFDHSLGGFAVKAGIHSMSILSNRQRSNYEASDAEALANKDRALEVMRGKKESKQSKSEEVSTAKEAIQDLTRKIADDSSSIFLR